MGEFRTIRMMNVKPMVSSIGYSLVEKKVIRFMKSKVFLILKNSEVIYRSEFLENEDGIINLH